MRVDFEGKIHEFPDDASEAEIQAMLGGGDDAPAPAAGGGSGLPQGVRDAAEAYGRFQGLGARTAFGGGLKGIAGLGTLPVDALVNAGYGGHKLLAKTGLVSQPDPKRYYGGDGTSYLPATEGISDAINSGLDAAGLPKPESAVEKIATSAGEGVVGALSGAGFARNIIRGGVGGFLAAEPGVQAAASGVGGGAAGAIEADPRISENLPTEAKIAIPLIAGMATGTGLSAVRAFGGHVPGFGSVRTGSTEMRDALANTVVQGIADDPAQAARNLRARTRFEEGPDFVAPGYQELATNAAGDTGLAAGRQAFGDMAGGALPERMQQNNSALTRVFRREGADDLAGEAAHRQAQDMARQDLGRFGLAGPTAGAQDPIDVTPFLSQLGRDTDPQRVGTTASTRAAAGEIRREVRAVAERGDPVPTAGEGYGPIQRFMALPERVQSVRQSVSESLAPPRAGSTPALPSVANARGYTGRQLGEIDSILSGAVPPIAGPGGLPLTYEASLAARRGLRQEGNERSFMAALMENLAPNTNAVTGAREFRAPQMARLRNMRQQERSVPSGGNLSIERLTPARQEFLDRVQNIGEVANFGNSAGTASRGASTARTATTAGQIGNTIKANAAPFEKVLDFAGRNGLTILGRIPGAGQLAAGGLRGLGRLYQMGAADGVPDAATAVRGRLGRFETDRPAAIEMLTGRTVPQRGVGVSAARQAGRTLRFGGQGFLAGQLGDREERRGRRRPFGG